MFNAQGHAIKKKKYNINKYISSNVWNETIDGKKSSETVIDCIGNGFDATGLFDGCDDDHNEVMNDNIFWKPTEGKCRPLCRSGGFGGW